MRKPLLLVVASAAVIGAGVAGWDWYTHGRFMESTDNAYVRSDVVTVAPKVAGIVEAVPVRDNQPVAAGDVLMVIDAADYRASVAQAEAAVASARAAIAGVVGNRTLTRSGIAGAEAGLAAARADLARAADDLKRYQQLNASQYASTQKYQAALAEHRKATAAVAQAEARLETERGRLAVLDADQAKADADLARAEAVLTEARNALGNTTVRAATDGVVGNKGVQVGQYVRPGQQVMSVVPVRDVHVVANFKETQLGGIRVGQAVDVHVDAYPDRTFHGVIDSVAPGSGAVFSLLPPDNATGNFTKIVQRVPVKIRLDDTATAEALLVPGLSVEASVDTRGTRGGALAATAPPSSALTAATAFAAPAD